MDREEMLRVTYISRRIVVQLLSNPEINHKPTKIFAYI